MDHSMATGKTPVVPTVPAVPADAFPVAGRLVSAPAIGLIGAPGSGKDESHIGPAIYHELTAGVTDLVILDPKLEQLGRARRYGYLPAPEDADVLVYGTAPGLDHTEGFDFFGLSNPKPVLRLLAREPDTSGTHWQDKAGASLDVAAQALEKETGKKATMAQVAAVVDDPEAFAELRERHPRVDTVSENPNEMGSILSTARKALEPIQRDSVRRLMGSGGVRMPNLASPKRQIIFICPDPGAGDEAKINAAMVHALVQMSAALPERAQKVIMNEAASFCSLPDLPRYVEMYRAQRVYIWYVAQSMSQLEAQIGHYNAYSLWASTACQIVGRGAEPELGRQFSRYTNQVRIRRRGPRQRHQRAGEERVTEETRRELEEHHITRQRVGEWTMRIAESVQCYSTPYKHCQSEYLRRKHRREEGGR